MKRIIAKDQEEAVAFANAGKIECQREAFFEQNGRVLRAERLCGQKKCVINEAEHIWWSATKTVRQKMGLDK